MKSWYLFNALVIGFASKSHRIQKLYGAVKLSVKVTHGTKGKG